MRGAPNAVPHVLLCQHTMSEAYVGGRAVEADHLTNIPLRVAAV